MTPHPLHSISEFERSSPRKTSPLLEKAAYGPDVVGENFDALRAYSTQTGYGCNHVLVL